MATSVEDRLAALEAVVADLRAELARPPRRDSMSKTLTCPCCGSGSLLGVREVNEQNRAGVSQLALGTRAGFWGPKVGDPLQAFVCRSCRLVEWHVGSLDALVPDGHTIFEINRPEEAPPPPDAPYR